MEQKPEEKPIEKTQAQQEYDRLASIEAEREVGGLGEGEEHETLTGVQASAPKLSDMQTADKRLFPDFTVDWLKFLPVARILPEYLYPLKDLLLLCVLEEYPEMSFGESVVNVETAVGNGVDGEGRIEELILAGASAAKEASKEATKLGLP